jgi:hypothetical protein
VRTHRYLLQFVDVVFGAALLFALAGSAGRTVSDRAWPCRRGSLRLARARFAPAVQVFRQD